MAAMTRNAAKPDRRPERSRRALVRALVDLILERGYETLTVEDVAERAFRLAEEASSQAKIKAGEMAEDMSAWTEENADNLRATVREQPITSLLIALGAGAFLGAIFLRR